MSFVESCIPESYTNDAPPTLMSRGKRLLSAYCEIKTGSPHRVVWIGICSSHSLCHSESQIVMSLRSCLARYSNNVSMISCIGNTVVICAYLHPESMKAVRGKCVREYVDNVRSWVSPTRTQVSMTSMRSYEPQSGIEVLKIFL